MAPSGHASDAAVIAVMVFFSSLAVIATALRLFTRFALAKNAGWDDGVITLATATCIALNICTGLELRYAVGKHQSDVGPAEETAYLKAFYAAVITYQLGLFFAKLSILLQYLRIFPQTGFRIACFVFIGAIVVHANWTFWSTVFWCTPVQAFWDRSVKGKCPLNGGTVSYANASVNILTDVGIAVLPLPLIKQLNIPRRAKIALMLVFGLGGFTCLLSILRLESIYAATTTTDPSYNASLAGLWSVLEVDSGILCSCLPTLKALVAKFLPGLLGQTVYPRGTRSKTNGLSHVERSVGLASLRAPVGGAMVSYGGRDSPPDDGDLGQSPKDIRVVTVVHQEIDPSKDDAGRSDTGSTRDLIHRVSVSD